MIGFRNKGDILLIFENRKRQFFFVILRIPISCPGFIHINIKMTIFRTFLGVEFSVWKIVKVTSWTVLRGILSRNGG